MANNELLNVKQVMETERPDEVNDCLARGWKLIATFTYMPYQGEHGNLRLVYSLGWFSDLDELEYLQMEKDELADD